MQDHPKWVQYSLILGPHIKQIFTDDAEIKIDIEELESEENLQAFFHALSTVVPCDLFNRIVGERKNHLEFNHVANLLCFGFVKVEKSE
jgi:hypothetical protein